MMRRLGKRMVALTLTAALATSLWPGGYLPGAGEAVYAAEAEEVLVWSGEDDTLVFTAGSDAAWSDAVFATNISDVTVGTNVKLTAKVTADGNYSDLDGEENGDASNAIQLAGAIKTGDSWIYAKSGDYPFLKAENLTDGEAEVTFHYEAEAGDLKEILFQYNVSEAYTGTITISDVKLYSVVEEEPVLPEKEPTVVADFAENANGWLPEAGYAYHGGDSASGGTAKTVIAWDSARQALKVSLDYSLDSGESWSEAKVKYYNEEGIDVSAYNRITCKLTYPEALEGKFKAKVFAKNDTSDTEIINKDTAFSAETTENGMCTATVTLKFSPGEEKITSLTLGMIGVNTDFAGDVYLDDVTFSQYNAGADFVDITETPGAGTQADITGMPASVFLADKDATASTLALYSYLLNMDAKNQVLFGHQNDTHKQVNAAGSGSDTKDLTGSISGVTGIDSLALTGAELGLDDTDTAVARAVEIGKAAAEEGAILSLSTHMPNMSNAKITQNADGTYNFAACDFNESKDLSNNCAKEVLPGGRYNEQFKDYLDVIAAYAKGLGDIPVMFRPFHECDGGWFWWGSASTDDETYKALYRYTVDYLTGEGVHNFLYIYSPNGPVMDTEKYLKRYPGDDYVDVLAFDYYDDYSSATAAFSEEYFANLRTSCENIKTLAEEKGKAAAIAEAGVRIMKADGSDMEGILVKDNPIRGQNWYRRVNDVAGETGMSYFLLWANFSDTNFYIPYKYNEGKGQELINEFIAFYNEGSSVFANGTKFYGEAESTNVSNTNAGNAVSGYITNLISRDVIKEPLTLQANVKNADSVKFILKNGENVQTLAAVKKEAGSYTAEVSSRILTALGKTDIGVVELVAVKGDIGEILVSLNFISFGKDKETLAANKLEDFELYYGDDAFLDGYFTENSAAGCSSAFRLDGTNKAAGSYGGKLEFTLKNTNSEVWTGRIKALTNTDFSGYNALQMWVKPDGTNKKVVVQLTDSSGEEFEVYLTDFAKAGTTAKYVTIPFDSFTGKAGGTLNTGNITKFAVWCNSTEDNTDLTSALYFDEIQAVNITGEQAAKKDASGLIITDESISAGTGAGDATGSGSSSAAAGTLSSGNTVILPDGSVQRTETATKADGSEVRTVTTTRPDNTVTIVVSGQEKNSAGKTVEVTKTTNKDASGVVTGITEEMVIQNAAKNTTVQVTVETDGAGRALASANVKKTGTAVDYGTKTTISGGIVAQITEAAGTRDVVITQTVVKSNGKTAYTISVNAGKLSEAAGLKLVKYDSERGEYVLVNKKSYTVSDKGSVTLALKENGSYELVTPAEKKAIVKEILQTVKPANKTKTVAKGKKTTMKLSGELNMDNVASITYSTSKKSVATVSKSGKITAKKSGTVTVKAKVTLKDGTTKTVSMKVKVK
ncbi:MAG: Ig-like domain-containing protein [Muribaculaceae bacterium]|nr:Ig-like domain-containing protein [Roseburia sp.]MCM1431487.1 Ig-like domain-containing protein [Muribaculaceae bacterium]MCM1493219.1 Ig-like domain-containing protein [Muribaculaceae bacterium]